MLVLGIDPGLTRCGVGVVEASPGRRPQLVDAGVVRTSTDLDHAYRLLAIEIALETSRTALRALILSGSVAAW